MQSTGVGAELLLTLTSLRAAGPIALDAARAKAPARLVLVDGSEFEWQQARYREGQHLFKPADPVLVGLNTLQPLNEHGGRDRNGHKREV